MVDHNQCLRKHLLRNMYIQTEKHQKWVQHKNRDAFDFHCLVRNYLARTWSFYNLCRWSPKLWLGLSNSRCKKRSFSDNDSNTADILKYEGKPIHFTSAELRKYRDTRYGTINTNRHRVFLRISWETMFKRRSISYMLFFTLCWPEVIR